MLENGTYSLRAGARSAVPRRRTAPIVCALARGLRCRDEERHLYSARWRAVCGAATKNGTYTTMAGYDEQVSEPVDGHDTLRSHRLPGVSRAEQVPSISRPSTRVLLGKPVRRSNERWHNSRPSRGGRTRSC